MLKQKVLFFTILSLLMFGCGNDSNNSLQSTASSETKVQSKRDAERYRELVNLYVGKTVPYAQYDKIGRPETLSGTTNSQWVAYFPKDDFTIVTNKQTDIIRTVYVGKREL